MHLFHSKTDIEISSRAHVKMLNYRIVKKSFYATILYVPGMRRNLMMSVILAIVLMASPLLVTTNINGSSLDEKILSDDEIRDLVKGIRADPASDELLSYYWHIRICNIFTIFGAFIPDTFLFGNNLLARYFDYAEKLVDHGLGRGGKHSEEARNYLYQEILIPLADAVNVDLNSKSDDDRLILAKAIYYWVRDCIKFTDFETGKMIKALILTLPGLPCSATLFFPSVDIPWLSWLTSVEVEAADLFPVPFAIKSAVETASYGHATCQGQTILLATLLKLAGFEVSIGFISYQLLYARLPWLVNALDALCPRGNFADFLNAPSFGHMCIMMKDPGWGIGKWHAGNHFGVRTDSQGNLIEGYMPSRDIHGREINGRWILLDPVYSASNTQFAALDFDDNFPRWIGPNPNPLKFGIVD